MKPHHPPHPALRLPPLSAFRLQAFRLSGFFPALRHSAFLILHSTVALCASGALCALCAQPAQPALHAGFESGLPPGAVTDRLVASIDTTRAHSGSASLRIAPEPGASSGSLSLNLDGLLDFSSNCEFSAWVFTQSGSASITGNVSASDTNGERYTMASATGDAEAGKWCRLSGTIFAGDWRGQDRDYKLNLRTTGDCWIDDVTLLPGLPDTPAQVWPKLKDTLHAAAATRLSTLAPGATLALDPRHAALAPDTATANVILRIENPESKIQNLLIPAEGLLVFAIDATDDLDLTGTLHLEHTATDPSTARQRPSGNPQSEIRNPQSPDLRPAIRAIVLCNDTVIGAPSIKAAPWRATPTGTSLPGPAPDIRGERPPSTVTLSPWRMTKGRHYITIAGPHIRPGGTFARLELQAAKRPAQKPLYTFALLSDTHIGPGRPAMSNTKISSRASTELEAVLRQLKRENTAFALIAGDMTDGGKRKQFEEFAGAVKRAGLPVHACVGNHDTYSENSRRDMASLIPKLFPSGPRETDYALSRPPLRFIVLDGSHWRGKDAPVQGHRSAQAGQHTYRDEMLDWLRNTLAKDTSTPTIVVSHFVFYFHAGVSDTTGYDFRKEPWQDKKLMAVLAAAPNVVATLSGHVHFNSVSTHAGITCIDTPALAEWPNAYRVFRVFADRLEWEVRQIPNRGLIRESVLPKYALLWALSTSEGDIAGSVPLKKLND